MPPVIYDRISNQLYMALQVGVAVLTRWRWCAVVPDAASPSWFSRLAPAWRVASLWRTGRALYCRTATVKHNTMNVEDATVYISSLQLQVTWISYIYCPPTKLQGSNSFSRDCPSVSHSVHGEGSDVIITHDALDLTIQEPPPGPVRWTWDPTVQAPPTSPPVKPLLGTSGGQDWRPVLTCSPENPSPTSPDIWWPRLETCSKLYTWGTLPSTGLCFLVSSNFIYLVCEVYVQ